MMRQVRLLKGWPGKPSHPPLTDASIGAYTVGVAMLVLGALGVEEEPTAHGALLAIGGGLCARIADGAYGPARLARLARHPRSTPARTTATVHLVAMVTATLLFALTFIAHGPRVRRDWRGSRPSRATASTCRRRDFR
jgi:drug/metabolite transporter (DMT)-like permease